MNSGRLVAGFLLLVIGLVFLGTNVGWLSPDIWSRLWQFWPVILIILGLGLLLRSGIVFALLLLALVFFVVWALTLGANRFNFVMPNAMHSTVPWFSTTTTEQSTFSQDITANDLKSLEVNLNGNTDFTLTGDDSSTIKVNFSGPANAINNLSLDSNNGAAVLHENTSVAIPMMGSWQKVTGTITMPKSLALQLNVSGLTIGTVTNVAGSLGVKASGSSSVKFTSSTVTDPNLDISGTSHIDLDQCQGKAMLTVSGAGRITANSCSLTSTTVQASGSGDVQIDGGTIGDLTAHTSGGAHVQLPKPTGSVTKDSTGASSIQLQ